MKNNKYEVHIAKASDREAIYQYRYQVFAKELGQYPKNESQSLYDERDSYNTYLVVKEKEKILGFGSITPPHEKGLSIEQHIKKRGIDFTIPKGTYESRLLTVLSESRGSQIAVLLMLAICRWVSLQGGELCVALGRYEVMDFYEKFTFKSTGIEIQSGDVLYHIMQAYVSTFENDNRIKRLADKYAHCIKF